LRRNCFSPWLGEFESRQNVPGLISYVLSAPEGISKMASSDWLLSEMAATNSALNRFGKKHLLSDYIIIISNEAVVS
jgi:hypothetical protein